MRLLVLLLIAPTLAAADPPRVEVAFGDLAKFSDLRVSITTTDRDRQGLADELRRHIERTAAPRLPPGTRLLVTINDVDMAGEYPPIAGPMSRDLRVVRDVYPPRIDLEFRLVDTQGRTVREGKRELRDAGFMWGVTPGTGETLVFEKGLLDGWLQRELPRPR